MNMHTTTIKQYMYSHVCWAFCMPACVLVVTIKATIVPVHTNYTPVWLETWVTDNQFVVPLSLLKIQPLL